MASPPAAPDIPVLQEEESFTVLKGTGLAAAESPSAQAVGVPSFMDNLLH